MKGTSALMEEVEVETTTRNQPERLEGYVDLWMEKENYGFIAIKGAKEPDGRRKQWHFVRRSLMRGVSVKAIGVGVMVKFTPIPCPVAGKRDKATQIEVVG
jgi:hypothetical protein